MRTRRVLLHTRKKMKFEELHNCKECQGKIVAVKVDLQGVERCGYCGQAVDYTGWFIERAKELDKEGKEVCEYTKKMLKMYDVIQKNKKADTHKT